MMSGLDYNTAEIKIREKFSIQEAHIGKLCEKIKNENNLLGCVIIATCNRTEIYISMKIGQDILPDSMLMLALGLNQYEYGSYFINRSENEALQHLMETSAGLNSQIFGDDQIVSQVKNALALAREAKTTDSILETVFRNAIASAKRIKTEVRLSSHNPSVAHAAVEDIEKYFGTLAGLHVIVIGNGEMGRVASSILVAKGALVTVTIREYKYKPVVVPDGCRTVMYSERYENFGSYAAVISATASPHYTITLQELKRFKKLPYFFMDLAVPRDVEPVISTLGVILRNVDELKCEEDKTGLTEAKMIIEDYKTRFFKWLEYKMSMDKLRL